MHGMWRVAIAIAAMAAAAVGASVAQAQTEEAVAQLVETMQGENARATATAARGLGILLDGAGDAAEAQTAVEALIAGLDSDDAQVREQCARALGRIMHPDGLAALPALLSDEDAEVARAAADAMGASLSPAEAKVTLMEQAQANEAGRAAAYQTFAPLATSDDIEFLLAGVADEDWHVQMYALEGLRLAGEAGATFDEATYRQAASVLSCEYLDGSQAAIDFFLAQGDEEAALAVLIEAVGYMGDDATEGESEGSWRTRTNALRTINELGWPATGEALSVAIRQLGDRTANVRSEANGVLLAVVRDGELTESDVLEQLIVELESSESLQVRAGIIERLADGVPAEYSSRAEAAAIAALEASMTSESAWALRADAIALLGTLDSSSSAAAIAACLNDAAPNVFQAASQTLVNMAEGCDEKTRAEVAAELAATLERPNSWQNATAAARAASYYPARESVPPLAEALTDETPEVQEAAGEALATMAREGDADLVRVIQSAVYRQMGRSRASYAYGTMVLGATRSTNSLGLLSRVLESEEPSDRLRRRVLSPKSPNTMTFRPGHSRKCSRRSRRPTCPKCRLPRVKRLTPCRTRLRLPLSTHEACVLVLSPEMGAYGSSVVCEASRCPNFTRHKRKIRRWRKKTLRIALDHLIS